MVRGRLIQRIFELYKIRKKEPKWFRELRIDLARMRLKGEDNFIKQVEILKGLQETKKEQKKETVNG